jgi:hypothetical protein
MCVIVQNKYVPFILMRGYRAAGLGVNKRKDNIEMDGKKMALMIKRTKNNFINTYSQYRHFQSQYLVERRPFCPASLVVSDRSACTLCSTACLHSVMQHTQHHLYRKSSNIPSSSSKDLEPRTSHFTTKALLFPLHTHM